MGIVQKHRVSGTLPLEVAMAGEDTTDEKT
jgi:hypothetical protein